MVRLATIGAGEEKQVGLGDQSRRAKASIIPSFFFGKTGQQPG